MTSMSALCKNVIL